MPTKRTKRSRSPHVDDAAALAVWDMFFESGVDHFHQLPELGITTREEAHAAAPEAWARLGARFLERREPDKHRPEPWALRELGAP